jgi:TRAP-type C4-dicarboxylate transport system substrate-binding protein
MMPDRSQRTLAAAVVGMCLGLVAAASSQSCSSSPSSTTSRPLTISAGLSQTHFWVGGYMDGFADALEAETDLAFTRFYAGELVAVGGELDALETGVISVAAPMLAPYHEGRFPLSDVTQLPTYGTESRMITRAFQRLLASETEVTEGKTFYDYEIADKGLVAWGLGATGAYAISTTGAELNRPADFRGMPVRAGSALHTIVLERLGVTPVTMPAASAYEALSRGTIDGIILSIGDWVSYSLEELLTYTVTDVAIGHWQSYLAVTERTWNGLTDAQRETWDRVARTVTTSNAEYIDEQDRAVQAQARANGAIFLGVQQLPAEMRDHIARAATETWIQWIEQTERNGHPARATAVLWAELLLAQGGALPEGVADYLGLVSQ